MKREITPDGLLQTSRGPLILLFFDGYDILARPGVTGAAFSRLHKNLRYLKRTLFKQKVYTGFYTAFICLCESLERLGCDVRINDFKTALANPDYPIGIAGYPSVISQTNHLPNPRIFGHGDCGNPDSAVSFAADPRVKTIIQPSEWFCDFYRPYCGDKLWPWFAGINTEKWPDLNGHQKNVDFIVYDKIRWHREELEEKILHRVIRHLEKKGLTYKILRYGQHHQSSFINALKNSRAMIFLAEHETQGLAYQEAMSSGLPILAWDEGEMVDPGHKKFIKSPLKVSSVPYFDETCGMKFKIDEFEEICDAFWNSYQNFKPRHYVINNLSLEVSGKRYLDEYERIAR